MCGKTMLEQRDGSKKEMDAGAKNEIVTQKYEVTMFGTYEKNREVGEKQRNMKKNREI